MSDFLSIEVEEYLPFAPARVWRALTDQDMLTKWLMPGDFQPTVGHQFTFRTAPIPSANFDGIIQCRVLELEPERKLKFSWVGGSLNTTILWQLTPEGTGTRLRMVHDGFDPNNPIDQFAHKNMGSGWRSTIIPSLNRFLAQEVTQEA
jgi:uncharacterized protein YndB with AHSA1/START domain